MSKRAGARKRGAGLVAGAVSLVCVLLFALPQAAATPTTGGHVTRVMSFPPFPGVSNSSANSNYSATRCASGSVVNPGTFNGTSAVGTMSLAGSARDCPGQNTTLLHFQRDLYTLVPISSALGPNVDLQTIISGSAKWTGSFGNCTPVRGGSRLGYCEVDVEVALGVTDYQLDVTTGVVSGPVTIYANDSVMFAQSVSSRCGLSSCNWTTAPLNGTGTYRFHFGGLGFGHMVPTDTYDYVVGVGGRGFAYFYNNSQARLTNAHVNFQGTFEVTWLSVTVF